MHAEPGRAWTVVELARSVAMSRSAFAELFRELVGETPLDHLTQWRMARAANMMRANRPMKLAAIASAVGYESESSFGKAFRRIMGESPGQYGKLKERHSSYAHSSRKRSPRLQQLAATALNDSPQSEGNLK